MAWKKLITTHINPVSDSSNKKFGVALLKHWQVEQLPLERQSASFFRAGCISVSVLAYHFWEEDRFDTEFVFLECAILKTWRFCGMMKTILVVNLVTKGLKTFAERYAGWVEIQIEPSLIPGNIFTMSADCNCRLHSRFSTDNVLIIQNDGFPIRCGLDEFIGKWDFIGAPYVRNKWWLQAADKVINCRVCNGGFSLRSHKICEMASFYWNKRFKSFPDCRETSEDIFYTQTLPNKVRAYRKCVQLPRYSDAIRFAYDAIFPYTEPIVPLGFHGPRAFKILHDMNLIDENPT